MVNRILGLDLGVTSIGWCIVELNSDSSAENKILGIGSRVVPILPDEKDQFEKGNAQTKNRNRTLQRTARKTNFRYKMRREYLKEVLKKNSMLPESDLFALNSLKLYHLRAKAVTEKISLKELGRILLHLNQKRGYKSSRKEKTIDIKKESDYLHAIKERENQLNNRTIGQFFYSEILKNPKFEIKKYIYYRGTYIIEFDQIWDEQKKYYPETLTDTLKNKIRNEIIYLQRPLKSQKHLVGGCQFETRTYIKELQKKVTPVKVAPLSSPLFQVCKIWQTINNIQVKNIFDKTILYLEDEQRKNLFEYISNRERTSWTDLLRQIGVSKEEYRINIRKDITGNFTKIAIQKKLEEANISKDKIASLLQYNPLLEGKAYEMQAFYKLWHILYSVEQPNDAIKAILKNFAITTEQASILISTQLKDGFCSLSSKALRKILPHLEDGNQYDKACSMAGYNHSNSVTNEEKAQLKLIPVEELQHISRGKLRNPAVEKILNQLINIIKDIYKNYGEPNEIRIELARELKQNVEERNKSFKLNNEREKERNQIITELSKMDIFRGQRITNRDIEKYKLWREFDAQSPYRPNNVIGLEELYSNNYEIEHIIPKSLFFDDSFTNKCIAKVSDNRDKGNSTAYDFMQANRADLFDQYCKFIQDYYKKKDGISKTKFERLMTSKADIPQDFIERQLRETQYITKEAKKLLSTVCHNVWITSGSVTDYVRRIWGYDKVIHNLNFEKFKSYGLTEYITVREDNQHKTIERIKEWNKRLDHRHHAVDALTIACTTQGMIQKMNTLSSQKTREEMIEALHSDKLSENKGLLDKYIQIQKPFTTALVNEAISGILISFKAGKRIASISKNKIGKYRIGGKHWIPRFALHEETIYSKIKQYEKIDLKKLTLNSIDQIIDNDKKQIIKQHLTKYNNNFKKAFSAKALKEGLLKGNFPDKITIYREDFVVKYNLNDSFKEKDCESIVDNKIKDAIKQRLNQNNGNTKEAFKGIDTNNPIWINEDNGLFVKSVTCKTGLSGLVFAKRGYVKPGNNHHIAIYQNETGERNGVSITMWEAFERKKQGLPVIAASHPEFGILKTSLQQNEMFVFNMLEEELSLHIEKNEKKTIGENLYRVQKLSIKSNGQIDLWFRKHVETILDDSNNSKEMKRFINIQSISKMNGIKVKIDRLGNIKSLG